MTKQLANILITFDRIVVISENFQSCLLVLLAEDLISEDFQTGAPCTTNKLFHYRYENTIAGQFFGHTHYDHYHMFYDVTTDVKFSANQQSNGDQSSANQRHGSDQSSTNQRPCSDQSSTNQQRNADHVTSRPRPVSVTFIGPSVTTNYQINPGYRIYTVDGAHQNTTRVNKGVISQIIPHIHTVS